MDVNAQEPAIVMVFSTFFAASSAKLLRAQTVSSQPTPYLCEELTFIKWKLTELPVLVTKSTYEAG